MRFGRNWSERKTIRISSNSHKMGRRTPPTENGGGGGGRDGGIKTLPTGKGGGRKEAMK